MTHEQCGTMGEQHHAHGCCKKRISWSAILTGALIGVGLSFLLNLFSIALGLTFVSITKEGLITLVVGGLIGLAIGTVIVSFTSGFVAGYLGRVYAMKRNLGAIYGFTTWCVTLILATYLTPALGNYASFVSNFVFQPPAIVVLDENAKPSHQLANEGKGVTAVKSAATKETKAEKTAATKPIVASAQKITNAVGVISFLIFALFFLGAISSVFGGRCGMRCKDECEG